MQEAPSLFGRRAVRALLLSLLLAAALPAAAQAPAETALPDDPAARSILEKADQIRFPNEGFQLEHLDQLATGADQTTEERKYRVLSKGNDRTVVMITEPASERGQIMLMNGRDLWVFMPNVSQPVRLSLAQRLTGRCQRRPGARQLRRRLHAKLLRTEKVDGRRTMYSNYAFDRGVTYHRVLYWVKQKNNYPAQGGVLFGNGAAAQDLPVRKVRAHGRKVRPTRLVMDDALREGEQSVLEYSGMKLRELPDKVFTKDYLKRLE